MNNMTTMSQPMQHEIICSQLRSQQFTKLRFSFSHEDITKFCWQTTAINDHQHYCSIHSRCATNKWILEGCQRSRMLSKLATCVTISLYTGWSIKTSPYTCSCFSAKSASILTKIEVDSKQLYHVKIHLNVFKISWYIKSIITFSWHHCWHLASQYDAVFTVKDKNTITLLSQNNCLQKMSPT